VEVYQLALVRQLLAELIWMYQYWKGPDAYNFCVSVQ